MKIYILNNSGFGLDIINELKKKIKLSGIIGLRKSKFSQKIESFVDQNKFCKKNKINYIEIEKYNFSEQDLKKIKNLNIDILVILGWQRLVPKGLLQHVRYNTIGIHGSPFKINLGRGRSPQNWSIILGLKKFYLSIFKVDPGIDSGDIISTKKFLISPFDDISSSYLKTAILGAELLIDFLKNKKKYKLKKFKKQNNKIARYFPQRVAEDGMIDWNRNAKEIYDFTRALTLPYPCAFTLYKNKKIKIIKCIPFEIELNKKNVIKPGTIIKIFSNNNILVQANKSFILVQNYIPNNINFDEGNFFKNAIFKEQIKSIINRHKRKHKSKIINDRLRDEV
jgi:methionyl-tRNA formyltransferase